MPKKHKQWVKPRNKRKVIVPTYLAHCYTCGREHNPYQVFNLCPYCGQPLELIQAALKRPPKDRNKR